MKILGRSPLPELPAFKLQACYGWPKGALMSTLVHHESFLSQNVPTAVPHHSQQKPLACAQLCITQTPGHPAPRTA